MWLTAIELRNIKSYGARTVIRFEPGVNAICGPNGAGKSTLLEAVGFALFDYTPYSQKQFVREGEKNGEILISFVSALDEHEYQVIRSVGRGAPYVCDPEIKQTIVTGKQDVLDWLCEHLRVDAGADLKTLFTHAVGVPQGLLTVPFLETKPKIRKDTFDPLLQVEAYEVVWEKLQKTESYVRDQVTAQERGIARLEGQLERLPPLEQEATALEMLIAGDATRQAEIQTRLTAVTTQKEQFDVLKERLTQREAQLKEIQAQVSGLARQMEDACQEVATAETAQRTVAEAEPGYTAYIAAQTRLDELAQERTAREKLQRALAQVEGDLAVARKEIATQQQALAAIVAAASRLETLAPAVAQQAALEAQIRAVEHEVMQLRSAQARYQEEQQRLQKLEKQRAEAQDGVAQREELERDITGWRAQWQVHETAFKQAEETLAACQTELEQASDAVQVAQEADLRYQHTQQRWQEASDRLAQKQAELQRIQAQVAQRAEIEMALEALELQRQAAEHALKELAAQQQVAHSQCAALEERLGILQHVDQAECPVCRQPLNAAQAGELTAHYETERRQITETLMTLQGEEETVTRQLDVIKRQNVAHQKTLAKLPAITRATELAAEIAQQEAQVAGLQTEVEALQESPARLETARQQEQAIRARATELQQDQKQANQARGKVERRIQQAQEQMAGLPSRERLAQLNTEIVTQQQTLAEWGKQVVKWQDTPARLTILQADLQAIGDPRSESQRCQAELDKQPQVQQALEAAQAQLAALEIQQKDAAAALAVYAGLDAALAEQNRLLRQYATAHQQYITHRLIAQSLPERQAQLAARQADYARAQSIQEAAQTEWETTRREYDAEQHAALIAESAQLAQEQAQIQERQRIQTQTLQNYQQQIADLQRVAAELKTAAQERDALRALHEAVIFIRKTLREAGPHITQQRVRVISDEADRIFRDLMADHTLRLTWHEDYTITVTYAGEQRTFQQLSGGEQVAAALSVRLALLRAMSAIRVAFFDEPTAHLDETRRSNLAAQLTQIKGFDQLFVISHDDTFEQDTHHVVHVAKVGGVSQVEVL
ncbi:MAG TPA: SMC family ATPase [Anaerolineae bacterium]|nr:SMC family ATPase [Anaerolineae bacterium]HQI87036.1 SMC family ATPase [Anaerolineae bacterium]